MLLQAHEMSERGVYCARYTKSGKLILYAVDSKGDEARREVLDDDSPARIAQMREDLWAYLDVVDPRPQLRLLKPRMIPPTERSLTVEIPDPYEIPPILAYSRPRCN